jgi:beta-lactamase class A
MEITMLSQVMWYAIFKIKMKQHTRTNTTDITGKSKNVVNPSFGAKANRISLLFYKAKVNIKFAVLAILLFSLTPKNLLEQPKQLSVLQPLNSSSLASPTRVPLKTLKFHVQAIRQELPSWAKLLPIPSRRSGQENSEVVYNLKTPPKFKYSQELEAIVNDVVNLTTANSFSKTPLSITLIDAKTGETAGYQENTLRYPASVVKIFWMVALYGQIESSAWENEDSFIPYITKMIKESDNEAASFIIDQVTDTKSSSQLNSEKVKILKNKRQGINRFFQKASYKDINISQKAFPIDYLNLSEPKGSELQMLGSPIWDWNKITSKQAARLIYEVCYSKQAISQQASTKMCGFLKRDLNPNAWQKKTSDFNPVQSFLGESLSNTNVRFYSKAGLTSLARGEAAMVATENNQKTYILAIFAQDSTYASDSQIFPRISRLVYERMNARKAK